MWYRGSLESSYQEQIRHLQQIHIQVLDQKNVAGAFKFDRYHGINREYKYGYKSKVHYHRSFYLSGKLTRVQIYSCNTFIQILDASSD
jgi:hypothetical protein